MTSDASRLALGTVQFGLDYGVANRTGKVSQSIVRQLLSRAREAGVDTLDTAVAYGNSEAVLGEMGTQGWRVVSKLPALPAAVDDVTQWVSDTVAESLSRLAAPRLYGLLLHRPADLTGRQGASLYEGLRKTKALGLAEKIGISIYEPAELEPLMSRFSFDLVQAPFNVIDRRIESSGWLRRLAGSGVEVHTRSAFLQGLLLMDREARPRHFDQWASSWERWDSWLADSGTSALQACLAFALSRPEICRVVVGVDSLEQLQQMLAAVGGEAQLPPVALSSDDPALLNPSRWPRK